MSLVSQQRTVVPLWSAIFLYIFQESFNICKYTMNMEYFEGDNVTTDALFSKDTDNDRTTSDCETPKFLLLFYFFFKPPCSIYQLMHAVCLK